MITLLAFESAKTGVTIVYRSAESYSLAAIPPTDHLVVHKRVGNASKPTRDRISFHYIEFSSR